jgi:hypothetical protein
MRKQFDSILFGRTMLRLTGCNDAFKKAEKFLHYMDGDEKKFTEDSIRNWYVYTESVLRKYVLLSEENQDIIRQYILHAKKFENHEISYSCLYTQIYGEIR